jgi:hypothetical protein
MPAIRKKRARKTAELPAEDEAKPEKTPVRKRSGRQLFAGVEIEDLQDTMLLQARLSFNLVLPFCRSAQVQTTYASDIRFFFAGSHTSSDSAEVGSNRGPK